MSLANKRSWEGVVEGSLEIDYDIPVRHLTIINDTATTKLQFKFSDGEEYSTLHAGETVQMENVRITRLYLVGSGVATRVWALG